MAEVIIDLGEYGEILIEAADDQAIPLVRDPTEKAGFAEALHEGGKRVRVEAVKLIKLPLTGVARLLLASLPDPATDARYDLDQFSVEFNLGIKTEAGANAGAVAKIMPEGALKCTYTWTRKSDPPPAEIVEP